jgi:cell division protein FtsL
MSSALAYDYLPAPARKPEPQRTLQLVAAPQARKRPKILYGIVVVASIALVIVVQIALSLAITQDSFKLAELRTQQSELGLQVHAIEAHVAALQSPQNLAVSAKVLGMTAASSPAYLRLSDGKLFGKGMKALSGTITAGVVSNSLIDTAATSAGLTEGASGVVVTEQTVETVPTSSPTEVFLTGSTIPTPKTR